MNLEVEREGERERREAVSVVGVGVVVDDGDSDVNEMQRFNLLVLSFWLFCSSELKVHS